ncbi:proton-conducting transporter membrane subunit [Streptomyces sp. NBC_01216]|uniref:NADH-quinone oxidoreductase subunit 5 family protein n=1 Tax=Streptomyces sp. NBC_01216 TaxID=2903778 RepID=UPI002E156B7A|nr:proton-conducting transporter membrane subunit [Streptomyces sp. NBC_01216]
MSPLLWSLVLLPLVSGTLLALAGVRTDRWAAGTAVGAVTAALGPAVALAADAATRRPAVEAPFLNGLPVRLAVDGLSGVLVVTVTAVALVVLLFAAAEFGPEEARSRFFGLMLLFVGGMLVTVTAATLPTLLLGWELMGATSWALIGYWWREPVRTAAAETAFLTTRAADLGLYLAAGAALAARPGPLTLSGLADADEPWLSFVTAGLLVAALGKSAQLPFSFWLSRAMQGPSPVSALLHSAAMVVAGAYLLVRVGPLLDASGWGAAATAWTGAAGAVLLGLVAVAQSDLKQLLAASTCAQIGFIVLAAGAGATTGATLQLMAHAAAKSLLFLVAGAWLASWGTQQLPELRGAARSSRVLGTLCTVGALSLAGIPPLALWAAKDVLLAGALGDDTWLYMTGLAGAVVSAVYSVKILWFVWRPAPPRTTGRSRVPRGVIAPLAVPALACLALTPVAFPPLRDALDRYLAASDQRGPHVWEFALSAALALSSAVVVWVRGVRPVPLPGWAASACARWLGLEHAAHVLLVSPVLRVSHAAAAFDDRVVDRAVDASARATLAGARWTDRVLERAYDRAAEQVASGARGLGGWARRPQTGLLHQYLAQAVAAFTVLAVVLVLVR